MKFGRFQYQITTSGEHLLTYPHEPSYMVPWVDGNSPKSLKELTQDFILNSIFYKLYTYDFENRLLNLFDENADGIGENNDVVICAWNEAVSQLPIPMYLKKEFLMGLVPFIALQKPLTCKEKFPVFSVSIHRLMHLKEAARACGALTGQGYCYPKYYCM